MTTTDTKPHPLADAIPAELRARIKAHDIAAGRWLEPFMAWCETFVVLRGEHDEAEKSHPLGHIDGVWEEMWEISGFERLWGLTNLVRDEMTRLESLDPQPRGPEVEGLLAGRS